MTNFDNGLPHSKQQFSGKRVGLTHSKLKFFENEWVLLLQRIHPFIRFNRSARPTIQLDQPFSSANHSARPTIQLHPFSRFNRSAPPAFQNAQYFHRLQNSQSSAKSQTLKSAIMLLRIQRIIPLERLLASCHKHKKYTLTQSSITFFACYSWWTFKSLRV